MIKLIASVAVLGVVTYCLGFNGPAARASQQVARTVAPALEPSFTLTDSPALSVHVRAPVRQAAATMRTIETDADHVARLMSSRLLCGETYANDVGGRNADCYASR